MSEKKSKKPTLVGRNFKNNRDETIVKVTRVERHENKDMVLIPGYRDSLHVFGEVLQGNCHILAERVGWPLVLFKKNFTEVKN